MDGFIKLLDKFNTTLNMITYQFLLTPEEYNGVIFGYVIKLNKFLFPIAMVFVASYFLYELYCKQIDMKSKDLKIFIPSVVKLLIAIAIVIGNVAIIELIINLSNFVLTKVMQVESDVFNFSIIELQNAYNELGNWEKLKLNGTLTTASLALIGAEFILKWSVFSRMMELYMYIALAPIPMSSFGNEKTSGIGKNYLSNVFVACLKASLMVLVVVIFKIMLLSYGYGEFNDIDDYLHGIIMMSLTLITALMTAEKRTTNIVGQIR